MKFSPSGRNVSGVRPLLLRLTPGGREQEHRRQHPAAEQPPGAAIQCYVALSHESSDLFLQSVHVKSSG